MPPTSAEMLFDRLYSDSLAIRDAVRDSPALAPWFTDDRIDLRCSPPILCFGFPTAATERLPLVTIGINPSADEIRKECVRNDESPVVQFDDQAHYFDRTPLNWFRRAQLIMQTLSEDAVSEDRRASYGGVFGSTRNVIHLDITPVVTVSINKPKRDARKAKRQFKEPEELRLLLKLGAHGVLAPLLSALIDIHDVHAVVVLGTEARNRLEEAGVNERAFPHLWRRVRWTAVGSGPSDPFVREDEKLAAKTRLESRAKQVVREALLA